MKIWLRLYGFDELVSLLGAKEVELDIDGHTYGDLIHLLTEKYGDPVAKLLRQQVIRNSREWIHWDDLGFRLEDGDRLTFITMMGGG